MKHKLLKPIKHLFKTISVTLFVYFSIISGFVFALWVKFQTLVPNHGL